MKRLLVASGIAAVFAFASMGAISARDRADGGLNRAQGIAEASTHTSGPEASQKITFTDILVTGRPDPDGGD